jgi:hypothetical protein
VGETGDGVHEPFGVATYSTEFAAGPHCNANEAPEQSADA